MNDGKVKHIILKKDVRYHFHSNQFTGILNIGKMQIILTLIIFYKQMTRVKLDLLDRRILCNLEKAAKLHTHTHTCTHKDTHEHANTKYN